MHDYSTKSIFTENFLSLELLNDILNYLPWLFLHIGGKRVAVDAKPDQFITSLNEKATKLNFNQSNFKRLLTTHVKALKAGRKPTKNLAHFVRCHHEKVKDSIHGIPNTLDKARSALLALIEVEAFIDRDQVCDAIVLLSDEVSSLFIAKVVRAWKEQAKRHREEHESSPLLEIFEGDIFWVSHNLMDSLDGVSRYRFREHFGVGEFEAAFASVESMLATSLLEGLSGVEAKAIAIWGDQRLTSTAYNLWLVSRSRNLPNRIRDFVNVALQRIAGWQFPEGWWTDFQLSEPAGKDPTGLDTYRHLPSPYTTALCSLNLLKLAISEPMKRQGVIGAKWLLEQQNPDGSWSRKDMSEKGIAVRPDLFLTLLSLEAIGRSGIENVDHSIQLGVKWIMRQQNELGMWDDDDFPFPFMTVLVLEFLQKKEYFSRDLDTYLSMCREFLNRSTQLSLEENSNSHKLAIITAFQGIEAFLYSVLSHPNVDIKIFEKANETIGMRKALSQFQTYLQNKGKLKRSRVIKYRNSLDQLAYLRDQVVHKGIDITESMCRPLITDAFRFVTEFSLEVFGFDIWD
ncbi:terpene cyclase/mutase family protein [Desulfohalobiaceae bacterium Ax17]|uniref:prenyltransferase/squalene oxidase repeat-containing protein n=1 Tax=Desulfovulcanus ferrireducens TaxID=2831190 RepID=UPI00207BA3AC|nr:prenyltransferase/squalene oxidase repeat-containing protein [Desulfovulcanus ferrireducens]MBT8762847.1 terpene cyclase/mutase family protein [Desulfovulcanus ferrireducens]